MPDVSTTVTPLHRADDAQIMADKYVVWKAGPSGDRQGQPLDPDDFFVIRRSDVFGASAVYGYAATILTALEMNGMSGRPAMFSEAEELALRELCEDTQRLAELWHRSLSKKVPD